MPRLEIDSRKLPPSSVADLLLKILIEKSQAGDCDAFGELFQLYNARLCTYLVRMVGSVEIAHDLAQDTFFSAWEALPSMPSGLKFVSWLYSIATNKALSYLRHSQIIHWESLDEYEQHDEREELSTKGLDESVGEKELTQMVLKRLPHTYRTCLLLQAVAGFKQREIAGILGIKEKTVSANVSRGRELFRREYRRLAAEFDCLKERGGIR